MRMIVRWIGAACAAAALALPFAALAQFHPEKLEGCFGCQVGRIAAAIDYGGQLSAYYSYNNSLRSVYWDNVRGGWRFNTVDGPGNQFGGGNGACAARNLRALQTPDGQLHLFYDYQDGGQSFIRHTTWTGTRYTYESIQRVVGTAQWRNFGVALDAAGQIHLLWWEGGPPLQGGYWRHKVFVAGQGWQDWQAPYQYDFYPPPSMDDYAVTSGQGLVHLFTGTGREISHATTGSTNTGWSGSVSTRWAVGPLEASYHITNGAIAVPTDHGERMHVFAQGNDKVLYHWYESRLDGTILGPFRVDIGNNAGDGSHPLYATPTLVGPAQADGGNLRVLFTSGTRVLRVAEFLGDNGEPAPWLVSTVVNNGIGNLVGGAWWGCQLSVFYENDWSEAWHAWTGAPCTP